MKSFLFTSILAVMTAAGSTIMAQDQPYEYLGLPGDNLNLYAVMNLFQQSETIEAFEQSLNDENNRINNLDLNGDNLTDYIKVIDYVDGDVHTIVLQDVLGRNENQDVAVFTVQRFRDGTVQIQLTGDEALYGKNFIIEPITDETPNPGYTGRSGNVTVVRTTNVEIAAWPLVRFIFLPNYVVWHSSWYWGYYPTYWHPWRPFFWHYYYGYHHNWYPDYYRHYRHSDQHRYTHWNDFYYSGRRVYSSRVGDRIRTGDYRVTYSHPEQRRDGETLYVKSHPDRSTGRTVVSGNGNGNSRRSAQGARSSGKPQGNYNGTNYGSTRRSSGNVSNGKKQNTQQTQNNGSARRSSPNVTSGTRQDPSSVKNNGTERKSPANVNNGNRSTASPSRNNGTVRRAPANAGSVQTATPTRRAPATISERPASKPQQAQKASSGRGSRPAASTPSQSRKSSGNTKSRTATKKSSSTKSSDTKDNSKRR